MSLVQEKTPILRSGSSRPEVWFLRRTLLNARRQLLLQATNWASFNAPHKTPEDGCDLPWFSQRTAVDDAIAAQASATLQQFDDALRHMFEPSYGICRECLKDLPLSRLKREPLAVLCTECIARRLEPLAADAL